MQMNDYTSDSYRSAGRHPKTMNVSVIFSKTQNVL